MTRTLTLIVRGTPGPQGSKRNVGRRGGPAVLIESSKKVGPWRDAVEAEARRRITLDSTWTPIDGPVSLEVSFALDPPARMPKGRTRPTVPPDLDKLVRSTCDALTAAGVWTDDARVVHTVSSKSYVGISDVGPGAVIRVVEL